MIVFPALPSLLRRVARGLAALLALIAAGFVAVTAAMYFWVLPNIAEHRDRVAALMTRALGQRVTLEAVSGTWQQARPEFRVQGMRVYDDQGRPALHLPEFEASFAWRSLLLLEPRFNHIQLQGLALDVRRAADGRFYVGGVPVDPGAPGGGFSNWLLRQGRVSLRGATLSWIDEVRAAPPLVLSDVDFTLTKALRTHRFVLQAVPPPALARALTVEAALRAPDLDDRNTWNGAIEAASAGVSLPRLAPWFAFPRPPSDGWGAFRVKLEVAHGAVTKIVAGVDARELETELGEGLPPLRLARAQGQAIWQRDQRGQRIALENLRVAQTNGRLGAPFNVGLAWDDASHEISARAFQLDGWQALLPSLPMDEALRARLQRLQPQGRLDDLRFSWRGDQPGIDNFSVSAHFSGVGVAAVDAQPGVSKLSGRIEGDARSGTFEIDSPSLELALPNLFREPVLVFDQLQANGRWEKTARGRRLTLREMRFSNADLAGTAAGDYELLSGHPGVIDLTARLNRADGTAVHRYLPKKVGDRTVTWVQEGVVAGRSDNVQLVLRGDLSKFPFESGEGIFRVDAEVRDGVIDYVAGWPRIEGVEGRLLFQGKRMDVFARKGRVYGVALAPVKVEIADLIHHDEELVVQGEANGPAGDFVHFANASPVAQKLRGVTESLDGVGPMQLTLQLRVPLRRVEDLTLAGKLAFQGNTLARTGLPPLQQVRGVLDFTGHSLSAQGVTAQFLGGPLRVETRTRDGAVQILAQGRASASAMAPWLGAAQVQRLSGQTEWRGEIDLEPEGERVSITSDLAGFGSTLPSPLAKPAAEALALRVTSTSSPRGNLHDVRLGDKLGAIWRTANGQFERGEIRFGAPATLPLEPGLRLAGSAVALDISDWAALLPPRGKGDHEVNLSSVDLAFDAVELMGRRFQGVRLQGGTHEGQLRMRVNGRQLNGILTYAAGGAQPAFVSGQFKQLIIPAAGETEDDAGPGLRLTASELPRFDLVVEDFRLQAHALGRLEVAAHGAHQGLLIDKLQLSHPDSVFHMSGLWRDRGLSETRADLHLQVLDASRFLGRFGYPDTISRGRAEIRGNAAWEGSPADFSVRTLAGQLDFRARGGQFLKIEPGVGKLLGVLSLQSVRRRLNFDFRDIFNEGYAFDDIGATLRIARGVVYSDDFKMRGPAAKVNMSGLADLNKESVQLRVKVIPKLSEGVAVAGALLGGPLAGVGALAAQKMLSDPVEEAISQEYMVAGPWLAPDVKKLAKARSKSPVSEP